MQIPFKNIEIRTDSTKSCSDCQPCRPRANDCHICHARWAHAECPRRPYSILESAKAIGSVACPSRGGKPRGRPARWWGGSCCRPSIEATAMGIPPVQDSHIWLRDSMWRPDGPRTSAIIKPLCERMAQWEERSDPQVNRPTEEPPDVGRDACIRPEDIWPSPFRRPWDRRIGPGSCRPPCHPDRLLRVLSRRRRAPPGLRRPAAISAVGSCVPSPCRRLPA